jgi:Tfp pilus assembly protein PilV
MTLIEVLIAMMLLAVGVAGMISIQVLAMRDEAIAREDNDASRIARDVLEQVQRLPFTSVASTAGAWAAPAFVDYGAGYSVGEVPVQVQTADGGVEDQGVYQVVWRVNNVAGQASLRTVDVQVGWTDPVGRIQAYTASTLKYNP